MDTSGGAGESSGIFEKIFRVQFQFTKDTRYNKGMEHMEHFYKDDSSIFTHTIWLILYESFRVWTVLKLFVRFPKLISYVLPKKAIFSMKRMIGMISSLLRQSCRWLEVFEVFLLCTWSAIWCARWCAFFVHLFST